MILTATRPSENLEPWAVPGSNEARLDEALEATFPASDPMPPAGPPRTACLREVDPPC